MINWETMTTFIIHLIFFYSIYLILSVSLNFQYGYTGIPNFGIVMSMAGGAYVVGYLAGRFAMYIFGIKDLDFIMNNAYVVTLLNEKMRNEPSTAFLIFISSLLLAMIAGATLGFIASYPSIRLRVDYLLMTLIAIAEIVRIIGVNYEPIAGGTLGVNVPDPFAWMGKLRYLGVTIITTVIALMVLFLFEMFVRSPYGRLLRAVRDCEIAASSIGKDTTKIKMTVVILGSSIAAIAGVLYSFYSGAVIAQAYNRYDWTFWPWLMMMIGGAGNNIGTALGALLVVVIRRLIMYYKHSLAVYIPFEVIWLEYIMLGIALILVIAYRPQGLLPEKPTKIRGLNYKKIIRVEKRKVNS